MKNKMTDLNNHLFAELERLGDEDLVGDKLQEELDRAHAMTNVAAQIINGANLVLKAEMARGEYTAKEFKIPPMLTEGKEDA